MYWIDDALLLPALGNSDCGHQHFGHVVLVWFISCRAHPRELALSLQEYEFTDDDSQAWWVDGFNRDSLLYFLNGKQNHFRPREEQLVPCGDYPRDADGNYTNEKDANGRNL